MTDLTDAQKAAIDHPSSRLHVLACAGSGKTEVLSRRVVRLLTSGVDPASIIAFTFTEKAASELRSRIERRAAEKDARFKELPPVARGLAVGTTHGWALRALRETGGLFETLDVLGEEQEWALLQRVARRLGVTDLFAHREGRESGKVATAPAVEAFVKSMEVVHNELLPRDVLQGEAPDFSAVLERYEWLLGEMRLIPYRLMISHAVEALAEGGPLWGRLKGHIGHVFVDEFQDFNRAQGALLERLLALGADVTVVGDDDQAIYQWRGGDLDLFARFAVKIEGTESVPLGANHRCRPEIVAFAEHLVKGLDDRAVKELSASRDPSIDGAVEVFVAETAEQEARGIAKRIAELIAQGHSAGDIAVLYRSVRTSAGPLLEALRARGIQAAVLGKTSMMVQEEMALIAHIFVHWSGGTWYPSAHGEAEHVTRAELLAEIRNVAGVDDEGAERMLASLDERGDDIREKGVSDSVVLLDKMLGILGLPAADDRRSTQERRLGRMSELLAAFDHAARRAIPKSFYEDVEGAAKAEADEDVLLAQTTEEGVEAQRPERVLGLTRGQVYLVRLRAYLEAFASRAAEESPDEARQPRDVVQVMTVHQSKGLEFPVVFVPGLIEGRFPSALTGREQEWYVPERLFDRRRYEGRVADEARLLYVAITRARELVVLSWFQRHRTRKALPSPLLKQLLKNAESWTKQFGTAKPERAEARPESEILDIDFSSLLTFQECGYKYWLRHVCGFRPPRVPELGFGKLLHHLIAELARMASRGETPGTADVDRILARSFYLPFAGPIPAEKLHAAARRRVTAYVRGFGGELERTVQPEYRFEVPLLEDARIRGRIDLLLHADGNDSDKVELVDFKTSENRPPSEFHRNQLRLYATAIERTGLEPVRLSIHDLEADDGGRFEVPFDQSARSAFERKLRGWVHGISAGEFEPVEKIAVCSRCDFSRFCVHGPERRGV